MAPNRGRSSGFGDNDLAIVDLGEISSLPRSDIVDRGLSIGVGVPG